jgi:hypothetical protein
MGLEVWCLAIRRSDQVNIHTSNPFFYTIPFPSAKHLRPRSLALGAFWNHPTHLGNYKRGHVIWDFDREDGPIDFAFVCIEGRYVYSADTKSKKEFCSIWYSTSAKKVRFSFGLRLGKSDGYNGRSEYSTSHKRSRQHRVSHQIHFLISTLQRSISARRSPV